MNRSRFLTGSLVAFACCLSMSTGCGSDDEEEKKGNTGGTTSGGGSGGTTGGTGGVHTGGSGGIGLSGGNGGSGGVITGGTGGTGGSTGGAAGSGGTAGATGGAAGGGGTAGSAGASGGGGTAGTTSDAGCTGVELTVKNILNWCSVSIAGAAPSTAPEQTVCVAAGPIALTATAASATFKLGTAPWHETDGDTGNGEQGTLTGSGVSQQSAATVTVSGSGTDCVWICCPFQDGSGCPTANQCP